jgi:excisionase family DNA binding protein
MDQKDPRIDDLTSCLNAFMELTADRLAERVANRLSEVLAEATVAKGEPDRLLSVGEAAAFLGLSKSTLYKFATRGLLPSLHVGNRLRFEPAALQEYLERRRT